MRGAGGASEQPSALVIGGASGIGAAVVARYRERAVPVVVWDVQGDYDLECDIARPEQIPAALEATVARWGVPRWVTITAGVGHARLLAQATPEEWDRVMQVNARGPMLCLQALSNAMTGAGQPGSMVATASVSAHLVDRSMALYCASKAALAMVVKVAAAEWGPSGIRVNAIAPGVTRTPMLGQADQRTPWLSAVAGRTALGRLGEADDIAQAVLALHELEWVTGQIIDCDGGLALHSPIDSYGEALRDRRGE